MYLVYNPIICPIMDGWSHFFEYVRTFFCDLCDNRNHFQSKQHGLHHRALLVSAREKTSELWNVHVDKSAPTLCPPSSRCRSLLLHPRRRPAWPRLSLSPPKTITPAAAEKTSPG